MVSPRDPSAKNNQNQGKGNTSAKAFPFVHKECWIFYETDYSILRTAEGLEKFSDLPDTALDAEKAKKIAQRLGIPEDNIKTYTN